MFSRVFPSYHPRAGELTYFIDKILLSMSGNGETLFDDGSETSFIKLSPKHHTIRAGHRWKVGDKFSPRIWSGKPYRSKQITIAANIEVKQTWDFERDEDGCLWIVSDSDNEDGEALEQLAKK